MDKKSIMETILETIMKKKIKILIIAIVALVSAISVGCAIYCFFCEVPEINLNGEERIVIEANQKYIEQGANGRFFRTNIDNDIEIIGDVDTKKPGKYIITYEYKYGNDKTVELEREVLVEDKEAPVIELKGDKELTIYKDEKYQETGYIANDNVDGEITDKVTVEKNIIDSDKYEIIYIAKDSSENETSAKRTVNLKQRENQTNNGNDTEVNNTGVIFLTFDDGPSTDITPNILDILKEENVKATFFILNYGDEKETLVKREAEEGHSIGIHGYSHVYEEIYKSEDAYMENITKLQEKIKNSTGVTTYVTRFPGGSSNTVSRFNPGIMTILTEKVVNSGFKYYDWNVDSGDAYNAKTQEGVYNNVVSGLVKNRRNIVLMHDFGGNTKTLNALRDIIHYGKEQGYTFQKITKDTKMLTHGVAN